MPKSLIVKIDIKNPETAAGVKDAVSAAPGFSLSSNGGPGCDVMFIEIGYDLDREFKLIEHVRGKRLARAIFLTSREKDPELLLRALKAGVKEFFLQPLNQDEVVASLLKIRGNIEAKGLEQTIEKKGVLIGILGCKGGIGATTVAVNLAVSLREIAGTRSVALMDMNPFLGATDLFLDIRTNFSWADAAADISRMDSTYLLNSLYKHRSNIHVLPAPATPSGLEAAVPETMERLMGLMRSAFDLIVMDCSKSFDDLSLRMLALSDMILVVSELSLPSVINARKLLETLEGLGVTRGKEIKVVMNRYQKKSMISTQEAEKTIGKRIVSMVPNDYEATMSAITSGKALFETEGRSPVREKFRELAALLLNKETTAAESALLSMNLIGKTWKTVSDAARKFVPGG